MKRPDRYAGLTGNPESDLVERAVRNAGRSGRRQFRQAAVSDTFAVGSTRARELCRRFGLDPEDMVGVSEFGDPDEEEADE